MMLSLSKNNKLFFLLMGVCFLIYCYFAFVLIPNANNGWWRVYINPLNQLFLFASGVMLGCIVKNRTEQNRTEQNRTEQNRIANILIYIFLISVFIFHPVSGSITELVTGMTRLVYTAMSILFVYVFLRYDLFLPDFLKKGLKLLGEISYGVYLIHPVVFNFVKKIAGLLSIPYPVYFGIAMLLTLLVSYVSYFYFEKYFIKVGNR
ncbi:hypothetical protein A4G20_07650 [Pasteurellaceae bacterium RH1A]|nr:hypothetical protein A4G20_07650 [Pasteurellaceae bacterium RH1A]